MNPQHGTLMLHTMIPLGERRPFWYAVIRDKSTELYRTPASVDLYTPKSNAEQWARSLGVTIDTLTFAGNE